MAAYWINFFTRIDDPDRVAAYAALAGPAMRAAGGRSSPGASPPRPSRAACRAGRR